MHARRREKQVLPSGNSSSSGALRLVDSIFEVDLTICFCCGAFA